MKHNYHLIFKYSILISILFSLNIGFSQKNIASLVLNKVNNLRDSLHLNSLELDSVLNKAGIDHAFYLAKKHRLSHFQLTFSKETPSERIFFYKGNRTYVGENIASIPIRNKKKKILDQYKMAESLFQSWYNSPPHYQNMINPNYTKMGLGSWVSKKKIRYAAQVFSSNEITLPKQFKNSDISWGVRPAKFSCKDEPKTYQTMFFANGVEVDGNNIYFYFHDRKFFNNVIRGDNDGLAIDIVLREQLPCGKENQFHISKVHDGEMQRPIYKYEILQNNISGNPKKIRVKIGEVPSYIRNQQWEANVIIINNNKLCDYSIPTEVPSDIFPLLKITPYYDYYDSLWISKENNTVRIKDSMHIELLYERNKKKFFSHNEEEYKRMLSWGNYIDAVKVECFASVEGTEWYNETLLEDRKQSVSELLSKSQFDLNKVDFLLVENWNLMNNQINTNKLVKGLQGKSRIQIKSFLKRNKSTLLDSLLFEQRKTHIYAKVDTIVQTDNYLNFKFASDYDSTLSIFNLPWNKILREDYILSKKEISVDLIDSLLSKKELRTNLLGASSIKYVVNGMDSILTTNFLKKPDPSSDKQIVNYAIFLTKYWFANFSRYYKTKGVAISITPEELRIIISKLDTTIINSRDIVRLKINILLSGIHYYVAHNNWKPVDRYFKSIAELIRLNDFSPEEARELALFCNHFHKFEEAVKIMHPFHENKSLSEDGYFVLAKTSTLIRNKLDQNEYHDYMNSAKEANHSRYCSWLDNSFQIQRDEYIKNDFCTECK
jgi:hypothetical protein